jgi:hypothetical protein
MQKRLMTTTFCQKLHDVEVAISSCKQQGRCTIVSCLILGFTFLD